VTTRRAFLGFAALGAGAFGAGAFLGGFRRNALAAEAAPLIDGVTGACRRLAPLGWRQVLLEATGGELDITAADLRSELTKPLARIDRTYPGFGDFDAAGVRAISRGNPDRSLLYHAFASPGVLANRDGAALGGFATLAEIEAVENFVYGVDPPTIAELQSRAEGQTLGIVVYALHYRNTPLSVHGQHAELCFARAGIARLGSIEPFYDAERRNFTAGDEARPFDFRVVPRRFAAYIAVKANGADASFGPQDALPGDRDLAFWVPIHKLFSGPECIAGRNLDLELACGLRNDELAQFHRFLELNGLQNNWGGSDLENFPFVIKDEMIASLSRRPEFGFGVLEPRPSPLTVTAEYKGLPLTFPVDGRYTSEPDGLQFSSLQILPASETGPEPRYIQDAAQSTQRPAPEYLNIRHRLLANGEIDNLNLRPDMMEIIRQGGYQTLHYTDFSGDGWIAARCPQLEDAITERMPAYCMVGLPDFFPDVTQRGLMQWWQNSVPEPVRAALWAIPPYALSQTRIAANVTLPVAFSLEDTTITAIVSQPVDAPGPVQSPNGPVSDSKVGLPDGSPGLFDPGWDTSQGIYFTDPRRKLQKFLAGYGLGSPFVEDAKLCAALGNYWPAAAPDATRVYQPAKRLNGELYPYPTSTPLTDEEIGSAPLTDGKFMPWDGVRGPVLRTIGGRPVVAYSDELRVDYIDLAGTMTAAQTARIDAAEYQTRTLAMEAVYWSLGIHDPDFFKQEDPATAVAKILRAKAAWAVLSFRVVGADDPDVAAAEKATGVTLAGPRRYRFEVFRWGEQSPDPDDMRIVLVEVLEQAIAFVSGNTVLLRRENGAWAADTSMPT
jgi:hypothetical protein